MVREALSNEEVAKLVVKQEEPDPDTFLVSGVENGNLVKLEEPEDQCPTILPLAVSNSSPGVAAVTATDDLPSLFTEIKREEPEQPCSSAEQLTVPELGPEVTVAANATSTTSIAKPPNSISDYFKELGKASKFYQEFTLPAEFLIDNNNTLRLGSIWESRLRKRELSRISETAGTKSLQTLRTVSKKDTCVYTCPSCYQKVFYNSVQCVQCVQWFHRKCANFKHIKEVRENGWTCEACLGGQ